MGGVCGTYGGQEKCAYVFVGRTDGKSPLGRPRQRKDYNIKLYLLEVGWGSMTWIVMAQDTNCGGNL